MQPHGPYCLAGYSFGGFVVFEMAQQLHAAGETVSLLGLLDTIEWQYLEQYKQNADLRRRFAMYKILLHRAFPWRTGLWQATSSAASLLARKLFPLVRKLLHLPATSAPDLRTINRLAGSLYHPAVYPGHVTIFRSVNRTPFDGDDELLGWGGMAAGGIEVQDVMGTHTNMLREPNVRMLAEKLRSCLDRAEEAQRGDLTSAALSETRTARHLEHVTPESKLSASPEAKPWSALVPIQPNGARLPLFCIHALGTSLFFYRQMAAHLGPDQPFYALQSPLESQEQTRETSIEELASLYLKELQTFFPQGPYLVGGASLGGLIALEMCRQLKSQGKKPGLLVLFDTAVPGCDRHVPAKEQVSRHWQNFRSRGAVYLLQSAASKSEYYWTRLVRSAQAAACFGYHLVGRSLPPGLHYSAGGGSSQTSPGALHRPVLFWKDHAAAGSGRPGDDGH